MKKSDLNIAIKMAGPINDPQLAIRLTVPRHKPAVALVKELGQLKRTAQLLAAAIGRPREADAIAKEMQARWRLYIAEPPTGKTEPPIVIQRSSIHRPEYFHSAGITGITIPVTVATSAGPRGEWRTYIRRNDIREAIATPWAIAYTDDSSKSASIHLEPSPAPPAANSDERWSELSRQQWLSGRDIESPIAVVNHTAQLYYELIDFTTPAGPSQWEWATVLAAWTIASYVYNLFNTIPYLKITGGQGSGKTTTLRIIEALCFRPKLSSNITASPLFRWLHERGGTLLLDEAERMGETSDTKEVNNILLAGHTKGGTCTRTEDGMAAEFAVYGPKAIASITETNSVLASRCIPINLIRRPPEMGPLPKMRTRQADIDRVRDLLHIAALSDLPRQIIHAAANPALCDFDGRTWDVWAPLLCVAHWADNATLGVTREKLLNVAHHCLNAYSESRLPDADHIILATLRHLSKRGVEPTPAQLLEEAQRREPATLTRWSPAGVAATLRRHGISTAKTMGLKRYRHLSEASFTAIERRLGAQIDILEPPGTLTRRDY